MRVRPPTESSMYIILFARILEILNAFLFVVNKERINEIVEFFSFI